MRTNIAMIGKRAKLNRHKRGTKITLKWVEFSGSPTTDPLFGGKTGTVVNKEAVVKGFIHFPNVAEMRVKQFAEIEQGDAILDLDSEVRDVNTRAVINMDGLDGLRFVIDGKEWAQKKIGDKLAQSWDVIHQGVKLARTVLLRKAT